MVEAAEGANAARSDDAREVAAVAGSAAAIEDGVVAAAAADDGRCQAAARANGGKPGTTAGGGRAENRTGGEEVGGGPYLNTSGPLGRHLDERARLLMPQRLRQQHLRLFGALRALLTGPRWPERALSWPRPSDYRPPRQLAAV